MCDKGEVTALEAMVSSTLGDMDELGWAGHRSWEM